MRVGIYARVSKAGKDSKGKTQDTDNQLLQLRRYAKAQGWKVLEFVDHESGKHADRDAFQRLFVAASRRQIDVVLVWALDRFTRQGVFETFQHVEKLKGYGVAFESLTEAHFRTTGPAGELMLAIAAWIAKQERLRISERTKAGLERARKAGRVGGRPARIFRRDEAQKYRDAGLSWRVIERKMGIPQSTLRKALKSFRPVHKTPSKKR